MIFQCIHADPFFTHQMPSFLKNMWYLGRIQIIYVGSEWDPLDPPKSDPSDWVIRPTFNPG